MADERPPSDEPEYLQAVLDALPVAILQFNGPDGARCINAPAGPLLGWTAEEGASIDLLPAAFPDQEERRRFLDHLSRALPGWHDFVTRRGSGELREFAWAFARAADGSALAFGIDVHERRNMERRLRESEASFFFPSQHRRIQVEKLASLGTLAAGVAHELNNPMMAVMNYVDYAGRVARSEDASRALAKAQEQLERMRDLLQNMLAFARPSHEPTTPVDPRHVVEKAWTLMQSEFARRGIAMAMEIGEGLPKVLAREEQLQQIVAHLLMNARDALENTRDKRVRVRGLRQGEFVALEVEDSGPGVPEGIRDRVFDPFFTTKPPGRGTGLGLSVSRSIMLELGGDLVFQTADGSGAVFTLLLPVAGEGSP